jgi:hypothetical protein
MQDILPRFQKRLKISDKLIRVDLGSLGIGPLLHLLVKFIDIHAVAQIIQVRHSVQLKMETAVMDIPLQEI